MASFIFNTLDERLLKGSVNFTDLDQAGDFYVHLVTSEPNQGDADVDDLVLATGGNYAPYDLSVRQFSSDGTGWKLDFDDPTWVDLYTDGTAIVGYVICCKSTNGSGGAKASTDAVISYIELVDGLGAASPYTPPSSSATLITFTIVLPSTGVLKVD
jgi:hypothetical protein